MARTELLDARRQRSVPIWLIAIGALLLIARIVLWATSDHPTGGIVNWVPMEKAASVAEKSGKPVMYDFTAAWCAPCQRLEDDVFRNPKFADQINQRFVPVRVVDRQQEDGRNSPAVDRLQKQFRVDSFPTIVFATTDGVERGRMTGFSGSRQFERVMESIR